MSRNFGLSHVEAAVLLRNKYQSAILQKLAYERHVQMYGPITKVYCLKCGAQTRLIRGRLLSRCGEHRRTRP